MHDVKPLPNDNQDEGVTLSPDAPIGEPMPSSLEPAPQPAPGDGGIIGPGETPGSR